MRRNNNSFSTDSHFISFTFFSRSDTINYLESIVSGFVSLFNENKDDFDRFSADDLTLEQLIDVADCLRSFRSWMAKNRAQILEENNLLTVSMWYKRRVIVRELWNVS
jgi:hypothetical protein